MHPNKKADLTSREKEYLYLYFSNKPSYIGRKNSKLRRLLDKMKPTTPPAKLG